MEVTLICKGAVFNLRDNVSSFADPTKESRHNYVVIYDKADRFIQCMIITSMTNKEVTVEVPILCMNGTVSYIDPLNIHSMSVKGVSISNFKGFVHGDMDSNEFINMLIELHAHYMLGGTVDDNCDVIKKYKDYVARFWNDHKDSKEYREKRGSTVLREKEEKLVTVTPIPEEKITSKLNRAEKNAMVEKQPVSKYSFIPKVADIRGVMKRFDDESKWETQDLIYFATGYIKFGYERMNSYGEGIHVYSSSSMSNKYIRVIEELNKRGLAKEEMDTIYSTKPCKTSSERKKPGKKPEVSDEDYSVAYNMWKRGEINKDEAAEILGMTVKSFWQRGYHLRKKGILPAVR